MIQIRWQIKRLLRRYPRLFAFAQRVYHQVRFLAGAILLKLRYPDTRIVRYSRAELEKQRRAGFRSQFGQDYFVFHTFLSNFGSGVFVDVGCNHPEVLNNTFYLEKYAGWNGLSIDALPHFAAEWARTRNSAFCACAVGSEDGLKHFVEIRNFDGWGNMLSSFQDTARLEDLAMGHRSYDVNVKKTSTLLDEYAVGKIDFMSLDVEGAEIDVLAGLNIDRHRPKILLVENCRGLKGDEALRQKIIDLGYVFHSRIWTTDDVYYLPGAQAKLG